MRSFILLLVGILGGVLLSIALLEHQRTVGMHTYLVCNLDGTGKEDCGTLKANSYRMTPSGCAIFSDETTFCHITGIARASEGR